MTGLAEADTRALPTGAPGLNDAALLDLLATRAQSPMNQAIVLARLAGLANPETCPLGERDAALLRLRAARFGPMLGCLDTCPACAAQMELDIRVSDLLALQGSGAEPELSQGAARLRALTTADLAGIVGLERSAARMALARAAAGDGVGPDDIIRIEAALEAADPLAHLMLDLSCGTCGAAWQRPLDIAALVWAEAVAAARRVLREVHALARAYGWGEQEILAIPTARRRAYLDLVAP